MNFTKMKSVLCYGDSNTYGAVPGKFERYELCERWPGVLQKILGNGFYIIEEGLGGRTINLDDPFTPFRNGQNYLLPCLESHSPIDIIILFLGTNDLQKRYKQSPEKIGSSISEMLELVIKTSLGRDNKPPGIILISPPKIGKLTELAEIYSGAEEKRKQLNKYYEKAALKFGAEFLDSSKIIEASSIDGIHLDSKNHKKLAEAIAGIIKK